MIASSNINLKVPFNEKDQAKSLGARWNAELKLWYVPQGVDSSPFDKWFTSSPNAAPTQPTTQPTTQPVAQTNASTSARNEPFDHDIEAINARLRDAHELNQDAF